MTDEAIKQANDAFSKQISSQVARITGELNRLEQLLNAGRVDRVVLGEFRDAVNKVRKTSWHVQCWLEGDRRSLSSMLTEERIMAVSQMANHLIVDLRTPKEKYSGLTSLRNTVQKLERVLEEALRPEEQPVF